jgi:hypothetical protein
MPAEIMLAFHDGRAVIVDHHQPRFAVGLWN